MSTPSLKHVVEAALFAAGRPLTLDDLLALFASGELRPERTELRNALGELAADWEGRGIELVEVASGHRFQVRKELGVWMAPLWVERPPRYSRALLETLALVAYRQPLTRAEIEEVRGVSVSSSIIKTLMERDWIRVLGHREVPGRPALYGTTREFLDAFGLRKLEDLPPLSELTDLDHVHEDLFSGLPTTGAGGNGLPGVGGAPGEGHAGAGADGADAADASADGVPLEAAQSADEALEGLEAPGRPPHEGLGEAPAEGRMTDAGDDPPAAVRNDEQAVPDGDASGAGASADDAAAPARARGTDEGRQEQPEVDETEADASGRDEPGGETPEMDEAGVDEPEPHEPGGDAPSSTEETGGPAAGNGDGREGRDGRSR